MWLVYIETGLSWHRCRRDGSICESTIGAFTDMQHTLTHPQCHWKCWNFCESQIVPLVFSLEALFWFLSKFLPFETKPLLCFFSFYFLIFCEMLQSKISSVNLTQEILLCSFQSCARRGMESRDRLEAVSLAKCNFLSYCSKSSTGTVVELTHFPCL